MEDRSGKKRVESRLEISQHPSHIQIGHHWIVVVGSTRLGDGRGATWRFGCLGPRSVKRSAVRHSRTGG